MTALRWARLLRGLGHRVSVQADYRGERCDLLLALHARRSAGAVRRFHARHPHRPVIVGLAGTDLYRDLRKSKAARRSLELAWRLVLLQPLARRELPAAVRRKARVIRQSAVAARADGRTRDRRDGKAFVVCVLAHLRAVKDPLRAAAAARLLPAGSRVRVFHLGGAIEPGWAARARAEQAGNPRYRWLGQVARGRALSALARSRLLVLSSRLEGGANAISEALAAGVPVLASRVPGSVGILGADYPGLFDVGDTRALARLMWRAETERAFYAELRSRCRRLAPLVRPSRERRAWAALLDELGPGA